MSDYLSNFSVERDDGTHRRYHWRGWWIDQWTDVQHAGLYHEERATVLEFGQPEDLAALAAQYEEGAK